MTEHVHEQIVDLLEGRSPAGRREEIQDHLSTCADCAADFSLAKKMRDEVLEQGLRHLSPERIVALAANSGESLLEVEDRHLSRCAHCAAELEWCRKQPDAESILQEDRPSARPAAPGPVMRFTGKSPWTWVGATAGAAIVILLILVIGEKPQRSDSSQLTRLVRLEPLPVQIPRSSVGPGLFEESRQLGLEAYASGDYEHSIGHLRRAADLNTKDDEVLVYLGSAILLSGDSEGALAPLEQVTTRTQDRAILGEALWLVANARLLRGNPAAAVEALERLQALGGRHAVEARALLDAVRGLVAGGR